VRAQRADISIMRRRLAITEVLDKHQSRCPRCACPEAVVVLNASFEVHWQCVDCDWLWPASDEESTQLLSFAPKLIH
jgi:transposase-like protein